jgi:hypothetical protein
VLGVMGDGTENFLWGDRCRDGMRVIWECSWVGFGIIGLDGRYIDF